MRPPRQDCPQLTRTNTALTKRQILLSDGLHHVIDDRPAVYLTWPSPRKEKVVTKDPFNKRELNTDSDSGKTKYKTRNAMCKRDAF